MNLKIIGISIDLYNVSRLWKARVVSPLLLCSFLVPGKWYSPGYHEADCIKK